MAAAIIPIILQLEEELLPEEVALVKAFLGLFRRKSKQAITVKTPTTTIDLSSTSLDPDVQAP